MRTKTINSLGGSCTYILNRFVDSWQLAICELYFTHIRLNPEWAGRIMYNIKIISGYSKESVIEFLNKSTSCSGRFELPENGVYGVAGEIRVSEWYNTIPNFGCRKRQYLLSLFRDDYELLPLYGAKDEEFVKVNLGGDPERWGRTYKLTIKELNKALNEPITIPAWDADGITSKLEKKLFSHLQLVK